VINVAGTYTISYDETTAGREKIGGLIVNSANAVLAFNTNHNLFDSGSTTLEAGTIDISASTPTISVGGFIESGGSFIQSNGDLTDTSTGATALSVTGGNFSLTGGTINVAGGASFTGGIDTELGGIFTAGSLTTGGSSTTLQLAGGTFRTTATSANASTVGGGDTINMGSAAVLDFTNAGTATAGGVNNSGLIIGAGTLEGAVSGSGTVEASGGKLVLTSGISQASQRYDIASNATLEIVGPVSANNVVFSFIPTASNASGEIIVDNPTNNPSVQVNGMNVGTTTTPSDTNFIDVVGETLTVTAGGTNTGSGNVTVSFSNGTNAALQGIHGATSGQWFVNTVSDGAGGTDVFLSTLCLAAGTHIRTPTGERLIESLAPGDLVLTLIDGQLSPRPVKWVGRRRIDVALHPRPEVVAPVRIQRDALAENVPHTDLLLSPDHAVFVDGKLICARQLINGTTIQQEKGLHPIEYFHVELDQHAILLAEGLPAESYLNTGNQGFFANSGAPLVLHPDLTDETDYPTREAHSCAPFVSDEASVRPVWQRLADRAAEIGEPVPQRATTTDPDLRLRATRPHQGRHNRPIHQDDNLVIFVVPRGSREIRLISRAQSPTETRPWLEDRRILGVRVSRIVLRGMNELREIPLDHPDLAKGWWHVERNGQMMSRWTNGDAVVPLPAMDGPVMLEVHLAGKLIYAVEAKPEGQAERHAA
jgi:hypothetical protein